MLGHEVAKVLSDEFTVTAAVRDMAKAQRHGVAGSLTPFDALTDDVGGLIQSVRPDWVINAIGLVKQLPDGQSPRAAIRLNALFPHDLAAACAANDVRLIHVSTDCVFSGELPPPDRYIEADIPDARDVYGRTKLLGEVVESPSLTLRTSIIGWELDRASGLLEWFASQAGGEVAGFTEAWFSGLTTYELAAIVGEILREHPELTGLWHVASQPISKFELLLQLREALDLDVEVVPRDTPAINRVLDPSRFERATGYRPRSWDQLAQEYAERRHG
jgi:dTDP-4-dehydrorhamnose reductase